MDEEEELLLLCILTQEEQEQVEEEQEQHSSFQSRLDINSRRLRQGCGGSGRAKRLRCVTVPVVASTILASCGPVDNVLAARRGEQRRERGEQRRAKASSAASGGAGEFANDITIQKCYR